MNFEFERGDEVRDKITGFKGVVISRADHISGCNTYGIKPRKLKNDGASQDTEWLDEPRLEATGKRVSGLVDGREERRVRTGADGVPQATR